MHKLQPIIPDWDLNPHTVIIGGGPATLCFLIQLLRKGRLNDMLKDECFVILDKGEYFGCGHLHQKVVSCNYTGIDLTRLILRDPFYKQKNIFDNLFQKREKSSQQGTKNNFSKNDINVESTQKKNMNQRTSLNFRVDENVFVDIEKAKQFFEASIIGAFREVISTQTFQELIKYGNQNPPTSLVSYYLQLIGNTLLRYIYNIKQKVVFKAYHFVRQIQFQNDGKFNVRIQIMSPDDEQKYSATELDESKAFEPKVLENFQNICCKSLIVAKGQIQNSLDFDILRQKYSKIQQINSEYFSQDKGCVQIFKHLNKFQENKKKVVIIGDSYNAFACAQLLLNGPKLYQYDELDANSNSQFAFKRKSYKCQECFYQGQQKQNGSKSQTNTQTQFEKSTNQKIKETKQIKEDLQNSKCKCFGNIEQNNFLWKRVSFLKPEFNKGEIIIAHSSEIKVHFQTEKEAIDCDYSRFQGTSKNKDGEIHEFTGLKSPLRDLFYDIIEGYEQRIDLEPFRTEEELEKILGDDTNLIINASGFCSSDLIVKDLRGNQINLLKEESDGVFEVDEFCRIKSQQGSLKSMYGIGDNFALPSNHISIQSETHKSKIIRVRDLKYYNSVIPDLMIESYFNSLRNYKDIEKYIQYQDQDYPTDAESFNNKSPQKYYYNSFQSNSDDPELNMNQHLAKIEKMNKINFQRAENFHKKSKI
ncbi:hypothetical protein ABPG72_016707 [Tetrahymena utriculariae]